MSSLSNWYKTNAVLILRNILYHPGELDGFWSRDILWNFENRCAKRQNSLMTNLIQALQNCVLGLMVPVCNGVRTWHQDKARTGWRHVSQCVRRSSGVPLYLTYCEWTHILVGVIHRSALNRCIRIDRKVFDDVCLHLYFCEDCTNLHIHV